MMGAMVFGWGLCTNAYQVGGVLRSLGFTLMCFDDGHREGAQLAWRCVSKCYMLYLYLIGPLLEFDCILLKLSIYIQAPKVVGSR